MINKESPRGMRGLLAENNVVDKQMIFWHNIYNNQRGEEYA